MIAKISKHDTSPGRNRSKLCAIALGVLLTSPAGQAVTFFEMDFEDGKQPVSGRPAPVWSLPPLFDTQYGQGNHFQVTDREVHTGRYSLRFLYEGRNGFCNTCGSKTVRHSKSHDGTTYFVAADGRDLALEKDSRGKAAPHAEIGKHVFNRSQGFARWHVTGVHDEHAKNDRLDLELAEPGINGERPVFHAGDRVAIARECGVDGIIGKVNGRDDVDRRVDCNSVVTWFRDVPAQPPGTSIYRRMYMMARVDSDTIHTKLNYFRGGERNQRGNTIVMLAHGTDGEPMDLHLYGFRKMGPGLQQLYRPGNGLPPKLRFEPGKWYYVEQQYRSSSAPGKADGEFRLWFYPAGQESTEPVFELTGLKFEGLGEGPNRNKISLWGNTQHNTDSVGSWYLDDLVISDHYNGPVER